MPADTVDMPLPHSRARRAVQLAALLSVCIATVLCGSWFGAAQAEDRSATASRYADVLRGFNARFSAAQSRDVADHVLLLSSYYSLDPLLLVAIVGIESGWKADAVSPAGAQGLGQLMPATADGLSVRAFAAYENLVRWSSRAICAVCSTSTRATISSRAIGLRACRVQRGPRGGRAVRRHSAVRGDADLRGARDRFVAPASRGARRRSASAGRRARDDLAEAGARTSSHGDGSDGAADGSDRNLLVRSQSRSAVAVARVNVRIVQKYTGPILEHRAVGAGVGSPRDSRFR